MKIIDCVQGSEEWKRARLGKITASCASKLVTPKTGKPSASMHKYGFELLAEEILGRPLDDASSSFMERGKEMEEEARAWYAWDQDVEAQRVGFIVRDDGKVGCSPDALVGEEGCVEIKCLSAANHLAYLLGDVDNNEYFAQVQFTLWITERKWLDFLAYNPELPQVLVRFQRNEEFIGKLSACTNELLGILDGHRATLRELGALPALDDDLAEAA